MDCIQQIVGKADSPGSVFLDTRYIFKNVTIIKKMVNVTPTKTKRRNGMKKRIGILGLIVTMVCGMIGCTGKESVSKTTSKKEHAESQKTLETKADTEIQVFIAASLNAVMTELAETYNEQNPNVKIVYNADSSGKLLTQIQEGYECDIFFPAAQKQMDVLEQDGLVKDGTRINVVNNQVVVATLKGGGTNVTGLVNLGDAESIALAGGSVPVGKYTRQALINLGMLQKTEEPDSITTAEVSQALGGVEISEQDNVSKVLAAITEGSCEVGTTYYSDTYGFENDVDILETVSYDLTGDVIYPICQVVNEEADKKQTKAAAEFYRFLLSDEAKSVFQSYYFDTKVER